MGEYRELPLAMTRNKVATLTRTALVAHVLGFNDSQKAVMHHIRLCNLRNRSNSFSR
jgi:hypothetical protein